MQATLRGENGRVFERVLEVLAMLDEIAAERPHGCVFLRTIAMGNDNLHGQARCGRGKGDALAVIAARRRDHAPYFGVLLDEPLHV